MQLSCLVIDRKGPSVSMVMNEVLYQKATQMWSDGEGEADLAGQDFTAKLTTEGRPSLLGTFSGIAFTAVVHWEAGKTRIDFLVPRNKLPPGAVIWINGGIPTKSPDTTVWN